jgi:hypothetical protein
VIISCVPGKCLLLRVAQEEPSRQMSAATAIEANFVIIIHLP